MASEEKQERPVNSVRIFKHEDWSPIRGLYYVGMQSPKGNEQIGTLRTELSHSKLSEALAGIVEVAP